MGPEGYSGTNVASNAAKVGGRHRRTRKHRSIKRGGSKKRSHSRVRRRRRSRKH
tara:strand:- start:325 stop:486 length:162 start_codon:yes stop_codon:yes gene_type:complete